MLLPFFEWLDTLRVGDWISTSSYAAPLINVAHILALVMVSVSYTHLTLPTKA